MIYRGPGFPAIELFGSSPPPPPLPSAVVALSQSPVRRRSSLLTGEVGDRIMRPREGLVLYKSFNTLCTTQKQH
jgi:hypothetical protein